MLLTIHCSLINQFISNFYQQIKIIDIASLPNQTRNKYHTNTLTAARDMKSAQNKQTKLAKSQAYTTSKQWQMNNLLYQVRK